MTISNRLIFTLTLVCAILFCLFSTPPVFADTENRPEKVIVVFSKDTHLNKSEKTKLASSVGGLVTLDLSFMNAVALEVPEKATMQILAHKPGVIGVYEDLEMTLVGKPTPAPAPAPAEILDWGVDKIDADMVWSTGYTGAGINVAVLDTGIDYDHPDLAQNVKGGVGYITREVWSTDGNGHGTHVSGTIAGVDNEIGVRGVAYNANLYGVQVLNKKGSGTLSALLSGLNWAITNNMDVITMSLGFTPGTTLEQLPGLKEQLDAAENAGIVVVSAAGNDALNTVSYPGAYPTVIAVAATNKDDSLAYYSNYGIETDIVAPGTSIFSTWKGGTYNTISGTSMATPHVTGVVALVLDKSETMSAANVRTLIASSEKPILSSTIYSFGRIDAVQALSF